LFAESSLIRSVKDADFGTSAGVNSPGRGQPDAFAGVSSTKSAAGFKALDYGLVPKTRSIAVIRCIFSDLPPCSIPGDLPAPAPPAARQFRFTVSLQRRQE
jgi:hypothetical protein